jgi:hypothetical protein
VKSCWLVAWTGVTVVAIRRLASSVAPIFASLGLVAFGWAQQLPWRNQMKLPPLVSLLFVQASLGSGCGFGCAYRELGGSASACLAAWGSVVANIAAISAPSLAMTLRTRGGWPLTVAIFVAHQIASARVWWAWGGSTHVLNI